MTLFLKLCHPLTSFDWDREKGLRDGLKNVSGSLVFGDLSNCDTPIRVVCPNLSQSCQRLTQRSSTLEPHLIELLDT